MHPIDTTGAPSERFSYQPQRDRVIDHQTGRWWSTDLARDLASVLPPLASPALQAEPVPDINGKPATAHSLLAALVDIYDDGQNAPPAHRCYDENAWREVLTAARNFLATMAAEPVEGASPALQAAAQPAASEDFAYLQRKLTMILNSMQIWEETGMTRAKTIREYVRDLQDEYAAPAQATAVPSPALQAEPTPAPSGAVKGVSTTEEQIEMLMSKLTTAKIVLANLPALPGYNGSILTIDDTEAEKIVADLEELYEALAAPGKPQGAQS